MILTGPALSPCGYPGCAREIYAPRPACLEHWMALPERVRECLWREYRAMTLAGAVPSPGQEHRQSAVRRLSLCHWVILEGLPDGLEASRKYLEEAKHFRRRALSASARDPFAGLEPSDVFDDDEALEEMTPS